jgi:Ni/Co efflux regulator RcnB
VDPPAILGTQFGKYLAINQELDMKKQLGMLVICGAVLMFSAPLLAQDYGNDHHDHDHGQYQGMHDRGQHEGWYRKGGRVPDDYRGRRYVVTDWRHEHLRAPPRGYHWVRSDNGDFLLVAITTGVIADLLLHH